MVMALIEAGFADHLMFSADASSGYAKTITVFLPKLKAAGATDEVLHKIMYDNPSSIPRFRALNALGRSNFLNFLGPLPVYLLPTRQGRPFSTQPVKVRLRSGCVPSCLAPSQKVLEFSPFLALASGAGSTSRGRGAIDSWLKDSSNSCQNIAEVHIKLLKLLGI